MAHSHSHAEGLTGRRLAWSVVLTLAFVLGEAVAGVLSHSLALLSDAGHNFADALALILSGYALWIARKPADAERTYGYHRVGILTALVNAVSLVVIALLIFWEAFQRLRVPEPVHSGPMIGVALGAVVLNTVIALWLRGEARHDLNLRSAYLHMAGDAASGVGVVIAGITVAVTGSTVADPAVSLLIGGLILWSSWGILTESVNVLLEAAPAGVDTRAVERCVEGVEGVDGVHHLHVWTVASGMVACSCHIVVGEQSASSGEQVLRAVAGALKRDFGIGHATVQVEVEGCEPHDLNCNMRAHRQPHVHGHTHTGGDHH